MAAPLPYTNTKYRDRANAKPKYYAPNREVQMYITGLRESGKTAIFKQLTHAYGLRWNKEEKKMMRFALYKNLYLCLDGILNKLVEINSPVLKEFETEVGAIRSFVNKNQLYVTSNQRKAESSVIPSRVKEAAMILWDQEGFRNAFELAKQTGGELVTDAFRLLLEKLKENPKLYKDFGTKKFLPDDDVLVFCSNGPKYELTSILEFTSQKNQNLRGSSGANFTYNAPHMSSEVLSNPLKLPPKGKNKGSYWGIKLIEKAGKSKLPTVINDKDCIVFVADIAAYDTKVGPVVEANANELWYRESVLKHSLNKFKEVLKIGHLVAVIFTHVDIFWEKYQRDDIPINVLNDFPDAPVRGDEQDNSIKKALNYFQKLFKDARIQALKAEGNEDKNQDVFKVFCVNAVDVTNVQGTLRALLEQYFGVNISINTKNF